VAAIKPVLKELKNHGGWESWLQRQGATILCLQETKVDREYLRDNPKESGALLEAYESFWCPNRGEGGQHKGLNGVATFAKKGTVVRADLAPLGDPILDREGRCLLTDHGQFVIFNCYIPNSSGGPRVPFKKAFLGALRRAMATQRAAGKKVMVIGDMNMQNRFEDGGWESSYVDIPGLIAMLDREERGASHGEGSQKGKVETEASPLPPALIPTVMQLRSAWPAVRRALCAKRHVPATTKNSHTGESFSRFRVVIENARGEDVNLGKPFETESRAQRCFCIDGVGIEEDGTMIYGSASKHAAHEWARPNHLSPGELQEAFKKVANVDLKPGALEQIGTLSATVWGRDETGANIGRSYLPRMLEDEGMVDAFAEFWPTAQNRATCWSQYTNDRYINGGRRIDYLCVDRAFFETYALRGEAPLDTGGNEEVDPDSPEAALAACTLNGLYQAAAFEGGGMNQLTGAQYKGQFRPPGTTIVYTPPQLSDHVAVTLLLKPEALTAADTACVAYDESTKRYKFDAETRKCQPHISGSKPMTSFFKPNGAAAAKVVESSRPKTPTGTASSNKPLTNNFFKPNTGGKPTASSEASKRKASKATAQRAAKKANTKGTLASMWGAK